MFPSGAEFVVTWEVKQHSTAWHAETKRWIENTTDVEETGTGHKCPSQTSCRWPSKSLTSPPYDLRGHRNERVSEWDWVQRSRESPAKTIALGMLKTGRHLWKLNQRIIFFLWLLKNVKDIWFLVNELSSPRPDFSALWFVSTFLAKKKKKQTKKWDQTKLHVLGGRGSYKITPGRSGEVKTKWQIVRIENIKESHLLFSDFGVIHHKHFNSFLFFQAIFVNTDNRF